MSNPSESRDELRKTIADFVYTGLKDLKYDIEVVDAIEDIVVSRERKLVERCADEVKKVPRIMRCCSGALNLAEEAIRKVGAS